MKPGDILIIEGISQKGKNRVKELGKEWHILNITDKVLFSSEKTDWILVTPAVNSCKFRWMKKVGDSDFRIVCVRT